MKKKSLRVFIRCSSGGRALRRSAGADKVDGLLFVRARLPLRRAAAEGLGFGPAVVDRRLGGDLDFLRTLAGQVDMSFPTLAAALPHVKAGTLRALAVTDTKRSPLLPDVPTLQEAGVQNAQFTQWLVLLAPAGTPPAVGTRRNAALKDALNTKEVRDKFQASAMEAFVTTPDEAGKFIASESTRFATLIKSRRITAD